ncbi:hypothetical protein EMIT043CA1_20077 [Pseudomonas brassicacearum]
MIFRLGLKRLGKDRSLASLDSTYRPSGSKLPRHKSFKPFSIDFFENKLIRKSYLFSNS